MRTADDFPKLIQLDIVSGSKLINSAFRGSECKDMRIDVHSSCFPEPAFLLCTLEVIGCIMQNHKRLVREWRACSSGAFMLIFCRQQDGKSLRTQQRDSEMDSWYNEGLDPCRCASSSPRAQRWCWESSILMFCFATGAHPLQTNESAKDVAPVSLWKIQGDRWGFPWSIKLATTQLI